MPHAPCPIPQITVVPQSLYTHCINPDCTGPYPQAWGNKFCQSCGAPLEFKGRYIPLQQLGTGGFAVIYTVWDLKSQKERVLKVLVVTSPKGLELFKQEAAVLARLRHPGVPRVESDSYFEVRLAHPKPRHLPCLVMEKINGPTLEDILDQYPQGYPEALVLDWLSQAIDIFQVLHRRNIVHRDIKPSNLMLRQETYQLVAIDFGGAKQIRAGSAHQVSSTRLVSPGYSPPEQIAGGVVGPAADFYALGRTFIHLLTGRYPADIEDPVTGQCRWRQYAKVSPALADLLDEMVRPVVTQRPANAAEIQSRLARLSRRRRRAARALFSFDRLRAIVEGIFHWVASPIAAVVIFLYRLVMGGVKTCAALVRWLLRACSDTFLGMVLGGIGGSIGAGIGFWLAYWSPVGDQMAQMLSEQLSRLSPDTQLAVEPIILLFAWAGLGTALGLTEAGSFGQLRRFWPAAVMGIFGYLLGWWGLHTIVSTPAKVVDGLMGFSAIAIACVTLGLGLPRHHLLHASFAAMGTAAIIANLIYLSPYSFNLVFFSSKLSTGIGWPEFWLSIGFFGLLGSAGALCLGAIYYILIPCLRFLGFR
ncbi:serine/threonine-protein kinase [Microcoleus sp. FACHB-68]|uniref:serine/threonine-protein kinase n=1 Tax=Microcoleus sp. FACHB-68 TaxID=2692826 RepID=UPI00168989EE|nr:serine/threonine-protein kinase [Microcoleus sp. FACHB-68]MBD1937380.1 serine/threonine protein kinase [Microcoleus sp. FACHB-68]